MPFQLASGVCKLASGIFSKGTLTLNESKKEDQEEKNEPENARRVLEESDQEIQEMNDYKRWQKDSKTKSKRGNQRPGVDVKESRIEIPTKKKRFSRVT